ncbi:MAG: NADH-quinone oxidoreductase subunit H [Holosporales bacterium]|jgi:NADH-quinone oxidoreductase subunit H|nr:NADH-quinone oxidoreductase subunit H [Holosporales bacterium]
MAPVTTILVLYLCCIVVAAFMSLLERKLIARIQLRIGPSKCGPFGLLQPLADALKLMFKRDSLRQCTSRGILGVVLLFSTSLAQFAIIPITSDISCRHGLLIVLLCHAIIAFAEILIGLASRSKYGVIGGTRAYMQLLGANLPLMLTVVAITIVTKNISLMDIACMHYRPSMVPMMLPLGAIFYVVMLMGMSRCPFDFVEAESEIVAGAYVEYGGIMFAMIYLADYLNLLFASSLISTVFMCGASPMSEWHIPILIVKSLSIACSVILIRAILPRLRQDQMIKISLLYITPILLLYIVVNM